jgi:hypothetical protein
VACEGAHELTSERLRSCHAAGSCPHNNRRWRCRECNGASYTCEHGKIKSNCLECELLRAPVPPPSRASPVPGYVSVLALGLHGGAVDGRAVDGPGSARAPRP